MCVADLHLLLPAYVCLVKCPLQREPNVLVITNKLSVNLKVKVIFFKYKIFKKK